MSDVKQSAVDTVWRTSARVKEGDAVLIVHLDRAEDMLHVEWSTASTYEAIGLVDRAKAVLDGNFEEAEEEE